MSQIFGFSILLYLIYLIYSCSNSVENIEAVCESSIQGTLVDEIVKQIEMNGLKYNKSDDSILVYSTANYGRYTCTLTYLDGKVISSDFVFLD